MSEVVRRRFVVSGHVQGVWFRASAREKARELGIERGLARNLTDGRVEVEAEGAAPALEALRAWLERGPKTARVDAVAEQPPTESQLAAFTTA